MTPLTERIDMLVQAVQALRRLAALEDDDEFVYEGPLALVHDELERLSEDVLQLELKGRRPAQPVEDGAQ